MLIIDIIKGGNRPSFVDIDNYLRKNGYEYSKRTIDRDIENIRYDFGIEIVYDRSSNSYFIDKEKSANLETFKRFLEIAGVADLLQEGLSNRKNMLNYISFESENIQTKGAELLQPILSAILDSRQIEFIHENFQKKTFKKALLNPYLLKEYQDRWYVVGTIDKKSTIRTYGLDRISELEIKPEKFIVDKKIQPKELFANVIGLVYSKNKISEVVLSFTPEQANYVKTLPLHHSQEIIKEDENECLVNLFITPNFELKQRICSYGANVKVLRPEWLAKEIGEELKKAAGLY